MQKANYYKYILLAVLTAVVFLFSSVWGGGISVYAAVSAGEYSDVLEDLTNDPAFSQADYPEKRSDSGLSLIQIAESVDGELFLYVYQPSGQFRKIVASSVNISTTLPTATISATERGNTSATRKRLRKRKSKISS